MYFNTSKSISKHFLIKSYNDLETIKAALRFIKDHQLETAEISILGKFPVEKGFKSDIEKSILKRKFKSIWEEILGTNTLFGQFKNPSLGSLFIAGALTPIFLHKINDRLLGNLSSGPYGILRGLGISEKKSTTCIQSLNEGKYLLIIRGFDTDLIFLTLKL